MHFVKCFCSLLGEIQKPASAAAQQTLTLCAVASRPLHRMASNNLAVGAEALLKAGADPSPRSGKPYGGDTPLTVARQSRALEVIQVLMRFGAK